MASAVRKRQNEFMRFRPSLLLAVLVSGGVLLIGACTTDYQQGKGDPAFGGPNALAGQRPPGATTDVLDEAGAAGTSGGPVGSKTKCGTPVGGGACAVTFSKDVLGAFGLANCATANCHGGAVPRNEPRIEPSEAAGMWQEFQAFTISTGKAYINPCSTDPTQSAMGCNVLADPSSCGGGVHMPSGAQLPAGAIDKINTWLKCGAPNN